MSEMHSVAKRFKSFVKHQVEGIPGTLGRLESTGQLTVPVVGVTNGVYVKLYDDPNNLIVAIDLKTSRKPGLGVRVHENTSGNYEIAGLDTTIVSQFLGDAAPSANIPPVQGAAINILLESYQFKPGRIRALNGSDLQVHMEELVLGNLSLGNINGNSATAVGSITSGKKAWIVISNDPVTNTLYFTKGTEYGLPVALTRAQAVQTVIPAGHMPVWAYLIRAGATYIPVQPQSPDTVFFADLRPWLHVPDATAELTTTNNTQTTIASIAIAEASLLTLTGTFSGVKSDYSAAISGTFVAGVRRASGGDATLVGVTVTSNEDSGGTPAFTVDADTGTDTARMRVTGITSEDWNWVVTYRTLLS